MNGHALADPDLVEAARGGDAEAFAAIYDRYGDVVHDFCNSVLRDPHEAADALHESFLHAWTKLDQLREPAKLRSWLYAIARHECYRRSRNRTRTRPSDEVPAMIDRSDGTDTMADHVDDAVLRETVWEAAGSLSEKDRALLDLQLRQGLEGQELADAVGVSVGHVHVLTSRLRSKLETALGSLMIARLGRDDCPELAGVLGDWDGRFSSVVRKRVTRHVDGCEVCDERRSRLRPGALYAAVPAVAAPFGSRERLMEAISSVGPPPPPRNRWRPRRDGFPPGAGRVGRRLVALLVGAGAAAVIAAVVVGIVVLVGDDGTDEVTVAGASESTPTPTPIDTPSTPTGTPTGTASAVPTTTGTATATGTPTGTATSTGTPTPTSTATPTPTTDGEVSPPVPRSPVPTPTTPPTPQPPPATTPSPTPSPTPTPTASPTPTPTPSPTPTPPPEDLEDPVIESLVLSTDSIFESGGCGQASSILVSAEITDDVEVAFAILEWEIPDADANAVGSIPMDQASAEDWDATLGPFGQNTIDAQQEAADIIITVTAFDTSGREALTETGAVLNDCQG